MQKLTEYVKGHGKKPNVCFEGKNDLAAFGEYLKKLHEAGQDISKMMCEDMILLTEDVLCGKVFEKGEVMCLKCTGKVDRYKHLYCAFQNGLFKVQKRKTCVTYCEMGKEIKFEIISTTNK